MIHFGYVLLKMKVLNNLLFGSLLEVNTDFGEKIVVKGV